MGNIQKVRWQAALGALLVGLQLVRCPFALALDAALDVTQYAHTAWKVRDGFTKGAIYSIAQTPDGYLWLGTDFGLYRFDGVRAVTWEPPPGQQLPSTHITCLMVSRDGTLWIGTEKGLASHRNGQLALYPDITGREIISLLEDREGTIWVGEWKQPDGRLCAIRKGAIGCYGADGSLGWGALSMYEDGRGDFWVGSLRGFWHWKPDRPKFFSLGAVSTAATSFAVDSDGALLIAAQNMGIRRFVDGKIEEHPYSLPNSVRGLSVSRLLKDRDGALWIGIYGGGLVHVHEGRTDVFTRSDGLSANETNALFQDREGSIWVATTNGLDRFRNFAIPTWSALEGLPFEAGGAVLAARDGSVWTGSASGLGRLIENQITIYRQRPQGDAPAGGEATREIVRRELPQRFFALLQDHRGRIWVSSWGGALGYFQDQQYHPANPVGTKIIIGMAEEPTGDLWLNGQQDGLFRLHEGKIAERVSWGALARKEYGERLAVDPSQGGLWVGYRAGGVTFFKDGQLRASYSAPDGLGTGVVNDLRFAPRGALWAATEGGLSRIKDGRITTLTNKNGLPCDTVHWSMEDDDHSVWLYMACGLVRIARSDVDAWINDPNHHFNVSVLDASDGVRTAASPTGYSPQVSRAPDGKIWFVTLAGISVIDPRHLPNNRVPPPVHIEQIIADRKAYDVALNGIVEGTDEEPASLQGSGQGEGGRYKGKDRVRLRPQTRDLQIDYTALSLVVPEKVMFRYKLEGFDKDWREAGNRRQAFYSNLPPRNYRFRVAACNNSGVWNEVGTFLDFSIAPAYYQTAWFRALCVVLFLVLFWELYQLRLRQLRRQFSIGFEARVNERLRIARELHDTLLQSFQGLLLRFQAISNEVSEGKTKQKLDSAIDLAQQAITEGRDAVQGLRATTVVTNDLAESLRCLGQGLAGDNFNPSSPRFGVAVEGAARDLHPILRDEVYRIGGEALRNAFHHAQANHIEVEIHYGASQLRLRIRDDGKGIAPDVVEDKERPGHWGLHGMRERAKIIGGNLEVWSSLQSGTEVELTIPARSAYATSPRRRSWFSRKAARGSSGTEASRGHE